ncbi:MAG: hypothetical protein LBI56_02235 [Puniceicoccales bacterium]|jgi:tRNA A37 threonylcarbamoyladenosine modification protein TsaB|nr:hypothetical protein [Puniceicoccales bacterium]
MKKHLLLDCATSLVQAILLKGKKVAMAKTSIGNATDLIFPLVRSLLVESECSFEDLSGMIYCSGPGSALGLRGALISMKTWMIFSRKIFELLEYNALDMCLGLNPAIGCVFTNGYGENLIAKFRMEENMKIITHADATATTDAAFLNTRRTPPANCQGFAPADYCIANAKFDIMSICETSSGELENYGSNSYKKWERKIVIGEKCN